MLYVTDGSKKKVAFIFAPSSCLSIFFTQSLINNYLFGKPPRSKTISKASAPIRETQGETVIHLVLIIKHKTRL